MQFDGYRISQNVEEEDFEEEDFDVSLLFIKLSGLIALDLWQRVFL